MTKETKIARALLALLKNSDLKVELEDGQIFLDGYPVEAENLKTETSLWREKRSPRPKILRHPFMVGSEIENMEYWRSGDNKKNLLNSGIKLLGFSNLGKGKFVAFIKTSLTELIKVEKGGTEAGGSAVALRIAVEDPCTLIWLGGSGLDIGSQLEIAESEPMTTPSNQPIAPPLPFTGDVGQVENEWSLTRSKSEKNDRLDYSFTDTIKKEVSFSNFSLPVRKGTGSIPLLSTSFQDLNSDQLFLKKNGEEKWENENNYEDSDYFLIFDLAEIRRQWVQSSYALYPNEVGFAVIDGLYANEVYFQNYPSYVWSSSRFIARFKFDHEAGCDRDLSESEIINHQKRFLINGTEESVIDYTETRTLTDERSHRYKIEDFNLCIGSYSGGGNVLKTIKPANQFYFPTQILVSDSSYDADFNRRFLDLSSTVSSFEEVNWQSSRQVEWELEIGGLGESIYSKIDNLSTIKFKADSEVDHLFKHPSNPFVNYLARNCDRSDEILQDEDERGINILINGETSQFYLIETNLHRYEYKAEYLKPYWVEYVFETGEVNWLNWPDYADFDWYVRDDDSYSNLTLLGDSNRNTILIKTGIFSTNEEYLGEGADHIISLGAFASFNPVFDPKGEEIVDCIIPPEEFQSPSERKSLTLKNGITGAAELITGARSRRRVGAKLEKTPPEEAIIAFFLSGETKIPIDKTGSFLFVCKTHAPLIDKDDIIYHSIEKTDIHRLDFPLSYEVEQEETYHLQIEYSQDLEKDGVKFWHVDTDTKDVKGETRSDFSQKWDTLVNVSAQMFYLEDDKYYLQPVELSVSWGDRTRQIDGFDYTERAIAMIALTPQSEVEEVKFFCYANLLTDNQSVIWSSDNCFDLLVYYLEKNKSTANLVEKNLYLAQSISPLETRKGKRKHYCDRFTLQEGIWKHDKLLNAPISGLGKEIIKSDFIGYFE